MNKDQIFDQNNTNNIGQKKAAKKVTCIREQIAKDFNFLSTKNSTRGFSDILSDI